MKAWVYYLSKYEQVVFFFVIYILIFCQNENAQFDVLECAV